MALTYIGADGLFTHLGKLIKHYNQFGVDATDGTTGLDADRDEILDSFQASDQDVAINGLVSAFERWKTEYVGRRSELVEYVVSRLQDSETVLKEIGASSADVSETVAALFAKMLDDSESVNESTIVLGSVSASSNNQGGGTIVSTDLLDGASSPGTINGTYLQANSGYSGLGSELCGEESFTFRVTADSFQDGLSAGDADISWHGNPVRETNGLGEGGSGYIGTIKPIHNGTSQYVSNADFENFSGDDPDDWNVDLGVVGTNINSSTDAAFGTSAVELMSDGSSEAKLSQLIGKDRVVANKLYGVAVKLKKTTSGLPTINDLKIQFEGTGYTPGSSETISKTHGELNTNYRLATCFVTMPSIIPDDFRLVVHWKGVGGGSVIVDDIGFGPVNYGGGVGVVAVRDSGPFVRGDSFTLSATTTPGVFQDFFTQVLGIQLPSSGTPTIPDSLAT